MSDSESIPGADAQQHVSSAVQPASAYRVLCRVIEELRKAVQDLETACPASVEDNESGAAADLCFAPLIVRRLAACVAELMNLTTQGLPGGGQNLCEVLGCPGWPAHRSAFQDAISVLQETKRRFKSKQLAELRDRLSRHLQS